MVNPSFLYEAFCKILFFPQRGKNKKTKSFALTNVASNRFEQIKPINLRTLKVVLKGLCMGGQDAAS